MPLEKSPQELITTRSPLFTLPEDDGTQDWAAFLRNVTNDPWFFAKHCVYTKDEVDLANPSKPFPIHFEYLRYFFKIWQKERMVGVPKSRRMFMSWATLTLHLWDAMWHPGRNIAFVSKKEEDADELIKKALFIIEHIPEAVLPRELRPVHHYKFGSLTFPEIGSQIKGYPQGADQLRMHTFSRIMADELAFWDEAERMYAASVPTLEGGGCMTAISSPAPGFFKRLVFDEIDMAEEKEVPKKFFPMEGVEVWRNRKNKFVIFQLHYSANPEKKAPSYRDNIKSAMPLHQYMQEYELSWETYSGKPVYPDWNTAVHAAKYELQPELGLPLLLGIDQGLSPACVVCQIQDETLYIFKEYTAHNMGAERFKEFVKACLRRDFPEWVSWSKDFIAGMDPTGFNRRDVDERTYAMVWADRKTGEFKVLPGVNGWEKRRQSVETRLRGIAKGRPRMIVSYEGCPVLVRGFEGGYRYDDKHFEIEPDKIRPIKDDHSQPHDALQYISTLMDGMSSQRKNKAPAPGYSWGQGKNHGREDRRKSPA